MKEVHLRLSYPNRHSSNFSVTTFLGDQNVITKKDAAIIIMTDLTRKELYTLKASQIPPPHDADDVFARHPRDYLDIHTHQLFCRNFFNADTTHKALILEHDCHAPGTLIVTADLAARSASMKKIEDIVVGDYVYSEAGISVVTALKTGMDDMYLLTYQIGDVTPYTIACNASHLITTTIGDVPISNFVDLPDPGCQLVMCTTPSLRPIFSALFTREYRTWNRKTAPSIALQTWGGLCGMKFVNANVGTPQSTWSVTSLTIPLIPFKVTRLPRGVYYGITLSATSTVPNPSTAARYILSGGILTHNTGTGKTITACSIISTYLDAYRKTYDNLSRKTTLYGLEKMAYLDEMTPCVLIVGFEGTQDAFFRELTSFTAFGFVTPTERDQLNKMRSIVDRPEATADDHRRLKDMTSKLRRRLSDKAAGGFIDFKGFQELVNFIFDIRDKEISLDYIEKESIARDVPATVIFEELIASGALRPRMENIRKYNRALIVVDELHNTYNSKGKNSRGIVIEYLVQQTEDSRFLGLTATLLNASPAEMVDVLGYIRATFPGSNTPRLKREDYFVTINNRDVFKTPETPELLGQLSEGYFSYLRDSDPRYYPRVTFMGDTLTLTGTFSPGDVKYQKFWMVPMSEELQTAHNTVIEEHGTDGGRIRVPIQSEIVFDFTLPLPGGGYMTSADQVGKVLQSAPKEFLDGIGIAVHRDNDGLYLTGQALMTTASRGPRSTITKGLEVYSPKYTRFLELLSTAKGKCMAFHKRVRGSGVILIAEILRLNGYVYDDSEPTTTSICAKCGMRMREHSSPSSQPHAFVPARFLMAYGQNKADMPRVLQKFNSPMNVDGSRYKLLVGSKVIRESYDFKAITDIFMLDEPNNISMTLQVYGRAVRKNSHTSLPIEDRNVNIHTIIHSVNPAFATLSPDSAQSQRYKIHMDDYLLIQDVDRARRKYAVDAAINAATIWGHGSRGREGLGPLPFDPVNDVPDGLTLDDLQTASFRSRRYFKYEMEMLTMMIKRLFISHRVYTYDSLVRDIRDPPFTVQVNPVLFDEKLIRVILAQMVNAPKLASRGASEMSSSILMAGLTNPSERRIVLEDGTYRIAHVGGTDVTDGCYILAPCDDDGAVIVDALIDQQPPPSTTRRVVSIDRLISGSHNQRRYATIRSNIIDSTQGDTIEDFVDFMLNWAVAYQSLFIEDCIKWDVGSLPKNLKKARASIDLVLSGMNAFGATVSMGEMRVYKQADKYLPDKKTMPDDTIVGYETLESVRILTSDGSFADVSKSIFNRMDDYRDVPPVIGFIDDTHGDKPRYKIRGIEEVIGIVCHTKPKEQLGAILKTIGVTPSDGRTRTYCRDLLMYLVTHEMEAREKMSKDKYFYGWWTRPAPKQ